MKQNTYATLHVRAKQALLIERQKTSVELQIDRMGKWGTVPEMALIPMELALSELKRGARALKRECKKICEGEPIYEFVADTVGLNEAVFVFLGCLPPLTAFANPAKLCKYVKLHVMPNGKAPTGTDLKELKKAHKRAVKAGEKSIDDKSPGWSPEMCAHALRRLAGPCVKMNGGENKNGKSLAFSPYRAVRDQRYTRTLLTHPPMLEEGEGCEFCDKAYEKRRKTGKGGIDCDNVGGHHWKPAHRDNDALRVTAKAILLDLWLVENGKEVVVGGQVCTETQRNYAPSTDIGEVSGAAIEASEPKIPDAGVRGLAE